MKQIERFGLTTLVVLMATAFASATSATGESTAFCKNDPGKGAHEVCSPGDIVTHVHSAGKITVLNTALTVGCTALLLEDALDALASPLVTHVNFTFSACHSTCTLTEVNGPAEIKFLKLGHEKAEYTLELEARLVCGELLNCTYNGVGLKGVFKGPLLVAEEVSGEEVLLEQTMNKVSGLFCPSTSKVDFLLFTLLKTHITN